MSNNTILVTLCIIAIICVGHLYIKNVILRNSGDSPSFNNINPRKKVTFGDKQIRLIHNNDTINNLNCIVPPDNIIINSNEPLELELKNHIDSIYNTDKIVYDEKFYKKDTLTGFSEDTMSSFSQFGGSTNYYPYTNQNRKKINKYNKDSDAHFTDDNFDLGSFFNDNQQFNDTTSAFVDNSKYNKVKNILDKSNVLIGPPLINDGNIEPNVNCDPYNNILNSNNFKLNQLPISSEVVDVDGLSLESVQYSDENINNGGHLPNGLSGFNGFNDIYSEVENVSVGKCHQ